MAKRNEQTSKRVASMASEVLKQAPFARTTLEWLLAYIDKAEKVAGSALTQTKPKRKGK